MYGAQVQSLFRELRSHMPWGVTEKKKDEMETQKVGRRDGGLSIQPGLPAACWVRGTRD